MPGRPRGDLETPDRERSVYCESYTPTKLGCSPLLALVSARWKYIHTAKPELYDLVADPKERNNRVNAEPRRVARLAEEVERVVAEASPGTRLVDPEAEKHLLALGYLKGEIDEEAAVSPSMRDAKDTLQEFNKLRDVADHIRRGKYETARRFARELLAARPDLIDLHRMIGDIAFYQKGYAASIVKYELYLRLVEAGAGLGLKGDRERRRFADVHQRKGVAHAELGQVAAAESELRRAISLHPELAPMHYNLGQLLADQPGREEEARAVLREALRLDPDYARAKALLEKLETDAG